MNFQKSVKVALAIRELRSGDLAARLKMSPQSFSRMVNSKSVSSTHLQNVADALDMPVSDLIKLGED